MSNIRLATWEEVDRLRRRDADVPLANTSRLIALIDAIREQLNQVLHDLRQSEGRLWGMREERREVLAIIRAICEEEYTGSSKACERIKEAIASRGDPAPEPPPDVVKDALRKCVDQIEGLEWLTQYFRGAIICGQCGRLKSEGHHPHCKLAETLCLANRVLSGE